MWVIKRILHRQKVPVMTFKRREFREFGTTVKYAPAKAKQSLHEKLVFEPKPKVHTASTSYTGGPCFALCLFPSAFVLPTALLRRVFNVDMQHFADVQCGVKRVSTVKRI